MYCCGLYDLTSFFNDFLITKSRAIMSKGLPCMVDGVGIEALLSGGYSPRQNMDSSKDSSKGVSRPELAQKLYRRKNTLKNIKTHEKHERFTIKHIKKH